MTKAQLLVAAVIVTLSASPVLAQTKGTIAEYDGRAAFVLKTADGKMVKGTLSGSRSKVTIKGAEGSRDSIKVGMNCTVTGPEDGEASAVACD
jgi:translation initiation factor IF-1